MGADATPDMVKAAAGIADDKFNANLMLAKIGDVNSRLERTSEAMAAYGRMVVKKPESAAAKVGRRNTALQSCIQVMSWEWAE